MKIAKNNNLGLQIIIEVLTISLNKSNLNFVNRTKHLTIFTSISKIV